MKKVVIAVLILDFMILVGGNLRSIPGGMEIATILYMTLITGFLLLVAWGFVHSQSSYIQSVEETKHRVLEGEGIACRSN